jgi:ABC-2 type transport system ATP-binding protein
MRQRLAMASAMLKAPKLLILDEPANGLDPAGIREMRDLMRDLAAAGVTVLLSSHILGEVQQICDSVTIIAGGRRVAAGPVADVLAASDKNEFRVRVADLPRAAEVLVAAGASVRPEADHLRLSDVTDAAWVSETLGRESLWVTELTPITPDLENVFLELTGTMPDPGHPRQIDDPPAHQAAPAVIEMTPASVEETSA